MKMLLFFTFFSVLISFIFNKKRTFQGLKNGLKMFVGLIPSFSTILILVSVFLYLIPNEVLTVWLGKESGIFGMFIAALLGSIALIPGFISFPLGAILIKNGVSYSVIAIFITTLMMVGVLTLPLEAKYFGWKVALIRNFFCFIGALIIGLGISLIWGLV